MGRERHRNPTRGGLLGVQYVVSHSTQAPACARPPPCGPQQHGHAPPHGSIEPEVGRPVNHQELSRLQLGDSTPRPAPCVREPNAGSTPVQRAMIALESFDKSRPPMPTERIKA